MITSHAHTCLHASHAIGRMLPSCCLHASSIPCACDAHMYTSLQPSMLVASLMLANQA